MAFQWRSLALGLAVSSAVLLAACGGGSDSTDNTNPGDNTENPGDNTNTGGNANTGGNTQGLAARLTGGTYASTCLVNDEVMLAAVAQPVRTVVSLAFNRQSDTRAHFVRTETYFDPTDTNCSGTSIGSVTWGHPQTLMTVASQVQTQLDGQEVTAYRVDLSQFAATQAKVGGITVDPSGIFAGQTIKLNTLVFAGDYFEAWGDGADLTALSADGNKMYFGDFDSEDASGYPTKLDTSGSLTRQP